MRGSWIPPRLNFFTRVWLVHTLVILYNQIHSIIIFSIKNMDNTTNEQKIPLEEKERRWNAINKKIDSITDKLGKPIDEEIKELIVGLNILGFRTTMSCFGHIRENKTFGIKDYALTPYVFIKPAIDSELEKEHEDLRQKVSKAKQIGNKESYREAYKEWQSFRNKMSTPYYTCIKQLVDLFAEFYNNRHVSYDAQVVVSGSLFRITIRNTGENYLYLMNADTKEKKLKEYHDEFIAFGKFLKIKYFSK